MTIKDRNDQTSFSLLLSRLEGALDIASCRTENLQETATGPTAAEVVTSMVNIALNHVNDSDLLEEQWNGQQAVCLIRATGNQDLIRKVLQRSVDVDRRDTDKAKYSRLEWACILRSCSSTTAKLITAKSRNFLDRNLSGRTPFHLACSEGSLQMVLALLDRGVNPDEKTNDGWPPLVLAAYGSFVEIVEVLVKHNVDINSAAPFDWNVIHVAASGGHYDVLSFLQSTKVSWEAVASAFMHGNDIAGLTALHFAAGCGHYSIIDFLLNNGHIHDVNILTSCPRCTALHLAAAGAI